MTSVDSASSSTPMPIAVSKTKSTQESRVRTPTENNKENKENKDGPDGRPDNGNTKDGEDKDDEGSKNMNKTASESTVKTENSQGDTKKIKKRRIPVKKTSRACNHCRKAHITCDEARPCTRCVSKGLHETCADAPRKVKKYLYDMENSTNANLNHNMMTSPSASPIQVPAFQTRLSTTLDMNNPHTHINNIANTNTNDNTAFPKIPIPLINPVSTSSFKPQYPQVLNQSQNQSQVSSNAAGLNPIVGSTQPQPPSIDREYGNFMSSAADLEYSILGSMVQNPAFFDNIMSTSPSISNSDEGGRHSASPLSQSIPLPPMNQSNGSPHPLNDQQQQFLKQQQQQQQHMLLQQQQQHQQQGVSQGSQNQPHIPSNLSDNQIPGNLSNGGDDKSTKKSSKRKRKLIDENGISRVKSPSPLSHSNFSNLNSNMPICDTSTNQYFIGTMTNASNETTTFSFPEVVKMISDFKERDPKGFQDLNNRSAISFSIGKRDEDSMGQPFAEDESKNGMQNFYPCGLRFKEPIEIYSKINEPFSYVQPYHDLNIYLRNRFVKNAALVSMAKSMAEYRPSFIAGMIHLKYEDLKFAEQCFQRTLLEYDNYIKISGTPTLVWRRTSQIAYVGDEFCILTGWSKDQLLGKSTFAVEIMDNKSCVEYFQLFSKIAFGDFKGATMTECTLLTPTGETIRTSSVWTLKRDVFGIPMMIIANFLPSLN